ncbi:MAG: SAM-dependent methyltransferase, partial [Candidatus Acidiferrales bacterium]
ARPGEQDLTAHVNFTALEKHGWELGLEILGFTTQTQFLLALVQASGLAGEIESMTSEVKKLKLRQQLKQLIHPEGMGEAFKVLVQARGVGQVRLSGLRPL